MPSQRSTGESLGELPSPSTTGTPPLDSTDEELEEELFSAEKRKGKKRRSTSSVSANERSFGEFDPNFNLMYYCSPEELQDPTEHVGDHRLSEESTSGRRKKKRTASRATGASEVAKFLKNWEVEKKKESEAREKAIQERHKEKMEKLDKLYEVFSSWS